MRKGEEGRRRDEGTGRENNSLLINRFSIIYFTPGSKKGDISA